MIKELCERHGVPCVYTSKLFFKRYSSSLTINFPHSLTENLEAARAKELNNKFANRRVFGERLREIDVAVKQKREHFIHELMLKYDDILPAEVVYRMNKVSVTFYFDDYSKLDPLIIQYGSLVSKVTIPHSFAEVEFLRSNDNKIVQDHYYLNQYPFRVTFKNSHNERIRDFVYELLGKDDERLHYYESGSNPILYLAEEDDLFLLKIAAEDQVMAFTEVVLRNNI